MYLSGLSPAQSQRCYSEPPAAEPGCVKQASVVLYHRATAEQFFAVDVVDAPATTHRQPGKRVAWRPSGMRHPRRPPRNCTP